MDRAQIYPTLAASLAKRDFAPAVVEKFGQLWDSIAAEDRMPCPLCFTYERKRSPLKALPARGGKEAMRCEVCSTVF
jgi:hypothetical protein